METNRRNLLQGMTGAALIAPYLAVEKAMAAQAGPSSGTTAAAREGSAKTLAAGMSGKEQIAMLLYPKFTALDLVGPHFFLANMLGAKVHLVTTEKDLSPVASDLGLAVAPTMTMPDAPKDLDILFVPGGSEGTLALMGREDCMGWVRDRASRARHITSVCTGSMVLAHAGLLRGKKATSHWATLPLLAQYGALPVDERVVIDGNIMTGAGVSAGLDFAIALVAMLRGNLYAQALMLQAEYAPQPPLPGGTLATTPAQIGQMMSAMFAPAIAQFQALSKSRG